MPIKIQLGNFLSDRRTRFLMAFLVGISTMIFSWRFLQQKEEEIRSRYKMTTVLVAKKYIPHGKPVEESYVEEKAVPVLYLQPTAIQSLADLHKESIKGLLKARVDFLRGEQLTRSKLINDNDVVGLSWIIPQGKVAVSLQLERFQAVGGFVEPGDWVSLLQGAKILLKRIEVLAVNSSVMDPNGLTIKKNEVKDMPSDSILVTLALSLEEARTLVSSSQIGPLSLALISAVSSREGGELDTKT